MGYEDAPDGEDCFGKIWSVSKPAAFIGVMFATYDTVAYTKPQGYVPTIATYLKSTVPLVAAACTFAAVTCTACNLRGKDDKINYLLGGASAGSIFGIAARSVKVGVPLGFFLAMGAMLYKDSRQNGWEIFPYRERKVGFNHMYNDYTMK
ncbi:NADH dehydrogenase [ubiquinone] 1 alpha subcomplex subunit 11 [Palaemon carinicauda]|uniref:NADH dehydrogenase [ubiquinone] 1 alpha subcomplex subunit 11 n=1 Tax=Palaemon carinicauda TaxID=392227 RepID=UPI0035B62EC1